MKKLLCASLFCVFLFAGSDYLWAGDAKAGKSLASMCAPCHGEKGISKMSEFPNLAGQREQYLVNSLKSYRNGTRTNDIMVSTLESLSDEDIVNLAAHFSSLECK